jgi:hypothetical protein
LPFVAMIWGWEESQRLLSHNAPTPGARVSPLTPRPFSTSQVEIGRDRGTHLATAPRPALIPANLLAIPSKVDYSKQQAVVSTADGNADLLSLVQKLSTQVDALTAMVAGQQKD